MAFPKGFQVELRECPDRLPLALTLSSTIHLYISACTSKHHFLRRKPHFFYARPQKVEKNIGNVTDNVPSISWTKTMLLEACK